MATFNLINIINSYCAENNILFIPGTAAYVNLSQIIDETDFSVNNKILIADFTAQPNLVNGTVQETRYSGLLALGQAFDIEDGTVTYQSTLDETYQQKFDRRLYQLSNELVEIIADISCENELTTENITFKLDINQFDVNADFVAATITFID